MLARSWLQSSVLQRPSSLGPSAVLPKVRLPTADSVQGLAE